MKLLTDGTAAGRTFDGSASRAEGGQTPVSGIAGEAAGRPGLAPAARTAPEAVVGTPAPVVEAPKASAAPSRARLFLKSLGLSGAFLAVDWGFKALFKLAGLPLVYHVMESYRALLMPATIPLSIALMAYYLWSSHATEAPLKWLDGFRKGHPILGNALYYALQVLTFPTGINNKRYAGDLALKYPSVAKVLAALRIGLAAVVAGTLGNGLEGLFLGKVIDFIPFGKATANISDLFIFVGLPFVWMALDSLKAMRKAVDTRTPATMEWWKYYLPFVLAQVGFVYSTLAGYQSVPMIGWYLTIFATLFLVGATASTALLQPLVDRFNRNFRLSDSPALRQEPVRACLGLGYRARRALAAGLASLLAVLPLHKTVSAPRLSQADRQALVERYREVKPKLVLMDWDKTFMDNWTRNNEPVTEERLELLRALKAAGIRAGFVTNRPLQGRDFGMASLLMDRMDPELRKDFLLSTGGGSEIYKYGPRGETPAEPKLVVGRIEPADMGFMSGVLRAEAARLGIKGRGFAEEPKAYELTFIVRQKKEMIRPLFDAFQAALKSKGLDKVYDAKLKIPVKAGAAPYIRVRAAGSSKAGGVHGILSVLKEEGTTVEPEEVLFFGDEFDPGNDDVRMAESLPAATAFAVGRTLDPSVKNAHLLPAAGADSTAAFLRDILRQPAPPVDLGWGYRARRKAAAILAALGLAVSAPRLPAEGRQALVERYRARPPKLVVLDYDKTFMPKGDGVGLPVTPERVELLRRLREAGVRVAFSTNRPFVGGGWGMSRLVMERLPADQRGGYLLATDGGAEVYVYGRDGTTPGGAMISAPRSRDEAAVRTMEMLTRAARDLGFTPKDWRDDGRMLELYGRVDKEFRAAGFGDEYRIVLRYPSDPEAAPEAWVAKADKADGLAGLMKVLRGQGEVPAPEDVLILGDEFSPKGNDAAMSRFLPGATALGVGAAADPRLSNTHLLPAEGPGSAAAFLWDILGGRPQDPASVPGPSSPKS